MADCFHFDPSTYRKRVSRIARHVVADGDAIPTIAPQRDGDGLPDGALTIRDRLGRRVDVATRRRGP